MLLTAHQAQGSEAANWSKLAGSGATLVIYMPGQNYAVIVRKLKIAGLSERDSVRSHFASYNPAAENSSHHNW